MARQPMALRAPFPWFGGKRKVADVVWRAFGPGIANYVEPFAGSLAVLLGRPNGPGKIETVNDRDAMLANFWRAIRGNPEGVADLCDWPVNETDLHARHQWLVEKIPQLRVSLDADPEYFDARIAGWWVWGICQWIGGGWCVEGLKSRSLAIPAIYNTNRGVLRKRPVMSTAGGVHLRRSRPVTGNVGLGVVNATKRQELTAWFEDLADRLRDVRVCCGDWSRVLGTGTLGKSRGQDGRRPVGVFLDPPYDQELRAAELYSCDDPTIGRKAREWALEHAHEPDIRIALCGYEGEHDMPGDWTCHAWSAGSGYAAKTNSNRTLERIWLSPHCLPLEPAQRPQLTLEFQSGGCV